MKTLTEYLIESQRSGQIQESKQTLMSVGRDNFHEGIISAIGNGFVELWEDGLERAKKAKLTDTDFFDWDMIPMKRMRKPTTVLMPMEVRQQVKDACIKFIEGMIGVWKKFDINTCGSVFKSIDPSKSVIKRDVSIVGSKLNNEISKLYDKLEKDCGDVWAYSKDEIEAHRSKKIGDPDPWGSFVRFAMYYNSFVHVTTLCGEIDITLRYPYMEETHNIGNVCDVNYGAGQGPIAMDIDMNGIVDSKGQSISVGDVILEYDSLRKGGEKLGVYEVMGCNGDEIICTTQKYKVMDASYRRVKLDRVLVVEHEGKPVDLEKYIVDNTK